MSRRKSLGQHFLIDSHAIARIVAAIEATPSDSVLEIGPGRGALTTKLIEAAGRIAAVEFDRSLAERLKERFDASRLLLYERDVLHLPLEEVAAALGGDDGDGSLLLVGNLPYSISKPIAQKVVRDRRFIARAVLMFQREVAERLTAGPGSRRYGPMSVLAGQAFEIRALFDVRPRAFRPPPGVDSQVTLWSRRAPDALPPALEPPLRACLAASFARRRRTIRNNLRVALKDDRATDALLASAEIDGRLRAEQVDPASFLRLAHGFASPL